MVVKWLFKAAVSLVASIIVLLYPEKIAGIITTVFTTLWDIAVSLGQHLHIPGTHHQAAAVAMVGLIGPLSLKRQLFADATPTSEQKEHQPS